VFLNLFSVFLAFPSGGQGEFFFFSGRRHDPPVSAVVSLSRFIVFAVFVGLGAGCRPRATTIDDGLPVLGGLGSP